MNFTVETIRLELNNFRGFGSQTYEIWWLLSSSWRQTGIYTFTYYIKALNELIHLSNFYYFKKALEGTAGMMGYGMAKAAVHQLTKSLGDKKSGLPENSVALALLPITLDTPMKYVFYTMYSPTTGQGVF